MTVDAEAELVKLRERLRLCQLELAQVRHEQEELAEDRAANAPAAKRLKEIATRLDKRLERGESVAGRRGRLKRRLLSSMPRATEDADLAVLRGSNLMNGSWYLQRYPDVVSTGLSPALHYLRKGAAEMKDPGPAFSTRKYLAQNPSLPAGANPLVHFHASHPGTTP